MAARYCGWSRFVDRRGRGFAGIDFVAAHGFGHVAVPRAQGRSPTRSRRKIETSPCRRPAWFCSGALIGAGIAIRLVRHGSAGLWILLEFAVAQRVRPRTRSAVVANRVDYGCRRGVQPVPPPRRFRAGCRSRHLAGGTQRRVPCPARSSSPGQTPHHRRNRAGHRGNRARPLQVGDRLQRRLGQRFRR